jgi:hypothetical protein
VILTGQQRKILREGIIQAYQNPDDLKILLSEEMDEQFSEICKGDDYNAKIYSLIEYFQNNGRLEEFIREILNRRPSSPYLIKVKGEFKNIFNSDLSLPHNKICQNMTATCQKKLEPISAMSNTSAITKANFSKVSETDKQLNSGCNNALENLSNKTKEKKAVPYKVIILRGNLDEVDEATIEAMVELLRQEGKDVSIGVKRIKQGSIKIIIQGTKEGLEGIQKLFDSGRLEKIRGFEVLEVRNLNQIEQEEIGAKSSIKEEESSQYYDNLDSSFNIERLIAIGRIALRRKRGTFFGKKKPNFGKKKTKMKKVRQL